MKDEDCNSFTDEELLDYISDGIAFIRRIILPVNPEFIATTLASGTLDKRQNEVKLSSSIQQLVDVRVNGKKVRMTNINAIDDSNRIGRIDCYCLLNRSKILFFPLPEEPCTYEIIGIKQQPELTLADSTPYNNDFDTAIFEYAAVRAGMGDMFQMSQEMQIMTNVAEQVENLIRCTNNSEDNFVRGYY